MKPPGELLQLPKLTLSFSNAATDTRASVLYSGEYNSGISGEYNKDTCFSVSEVH